MIKFYEALQSVSKHQPSSILFMTSHGGFFETLCKASNFTYVLLLGQMRDVDDEQNKLFTMHRFDFRQRLSNQMVPSTNVYTTSEKIHVMKGCLSAIKWLLLL